MAAMVNSHFLILALAASAAVLWSAWLVLFLREKGVNPTREILDRFGRLGWMKKVGVLFIVAQFTMFGGAKHGGTNDVDAVGGTNDVEIVEGGETNEVGEAESGEAESFPLQGNELRGPFLSGRPSQSLTSGRDSASPLTSGEDAVSPLPITDILRGYRLESVATNDEISYALPSDGEVRTTWHLTGAYEDVQKIGLGGLESLEGLGSASFKFPLGTNLCSSLWAYTWGKVRPQLKNSENEIAAVGAPMSAIPSVSRFWTMATTNDTYLLTWENFTFGRVPVSTNTSSLIPHPSSLVSAQFELSRNGDFITRSNNVESVYRRVIEPNPDPLHPYGPVQDLSVINETNAYCWVDIVVNNADAWVRFKGDGPSNLADPSFAAKAGETNHVVILIGKTYKVTCNMDFSVIAKSDPAIEERWEDDRTLWLNWPVTIEAWEGNGNSFRMHVVPGCLGGTFAWTESDCPLSGSGMFFSYSCDTNSLCSGCAARGHYDYEGYAIDCIGGWCGCNCALVEPEVPEAEPDDGPYAGGISVSFSDAAVIFEDGYANMPGEFVPRRSTRTTLSCVAHGGPNGGTATFSISGDDKLVRASGRSLPVTVTVPPEQKVAFEIVYEGKEPSERDIVATATFTEGDGEPSSNDARLTSVKVELTPEDLPPMNPSPNRHIMGIHEKVNFAAAPAFALVKWAFEQKELDDDDSYFNCPWTGGVYTVSARCGGTQLDTSISVVEPVVECREARWDEELDASAVVGESGWVGMRLSLYLLPRTVSFEWIEMEEIPVPSSQAIQPTGYFYLRPDVMHPTHDADMGAGKWSRPRLSDGSWTGDRARIPYACPPFVIDDPPEWAQGTMRWAIPVGCGEQVAEANERVEHALRRVLAPNPTEQVYEMGADGTLTIRKYEHTIRRDVSGRVWLDGSRVNAWWN